MKDFSDLFSAPWDIVFGAALVIGFLTVNALLLVWAERKVSARMQRRFGPTERGPAGLLQTVADMGKLLGKETITPKHVHKPLYHLAPVLIFAPIVAVVSLFPISRGWVVSDIDLGLLLVFAFSGMVIIAVFAAGWGSNNKYALLGAMRSVAQNIAYEIPLLLAALSVVMITGTMSLTGITEAQGSFWFVLVQPVALLIYLVAATAETNRAPFDIPEAESELVAGFHTEYSGMRFAMFFFAEYSNLVIVCAVAAVLFLGGWHGPGPDWLGPLWFFLKVYLLVFVIMWFRWTFPRLRFDQLMRFAWMYLVPLALVNLVGTALVLKLV
jgi:NADH-quinone oxidoreductase subunit H